MNETLFDFIKSCPTPFHAAKHTAALLEEAGFTPLHEGESWVLAPGKGYYVTRNLSSVIAFRAPEKDFSGFMIAAAHCDSPCFKIKEEVMLDGKNYLRLSTEKYGGMLCSSWMDRPLSIAGRLIVKTENGVRTELVDLREPCALIPNVAIHMNGGANDGYAFNAAVDMLPLWGLAGERGLLVRCAEQCGIERDNIISHDLILYNPQEGTLWNGFVSAPKLDDLQCAYGALMGFLASNSAGNMPVYCLFDNEEVGSTTKQGAASPFLHDVLKRACAACGCSADAAERGLASGMMLSCDNAHAIHPNHPELSDPNHAPVINKGIVIKYNANQKYTSDAMSAALFKLICREAEVPFQYFANRADMPGGSTLGNISNTHVALNTVDIGLPQLAMHSAYETAGSLDTDYLIKAARVFFEKRLAVKADGTVELY